MKRIFIVGCPRSGTTLLQSMLAGSPILLSLPESHILRVGIGRKGTQVFSPVYRHKLLVSLQNQLDVSLPPKEDSGYFLSEEKLVQDMITLLDSAAWKNDSSGWIEKTPEHIFYIKNIEKNFPESHFIHVVRNGSAVVASIVEMWELYTRNWNSWRKLLKQGNEFSQALQLNKGKLLNLKEKPSLLNLWQLKSFARASILWNDCLKTTKKHHKQPNHTVCYYEDLTQNPDLVLRTICNFLEIDFHNNMLHPNKNASQLISSQELWKYNNTQPIMPASTTKYDQLTIEQKIFISENLINSGNAQEYISR